MGGAMGEGKTIKKNSPDNSFEKICHGFHKEEKRYFFFKNPFFFSNPKTPKRVHNERKKTDILSIPKYDKQNLQKKKVQKKKMDRNGKTMGEKEMYPLLLFLFHLISLVSLHLTSFR